MTRNRPSIRVWAVLLMATLTAACASQKNDLNTPPPPLGRFLLGLNIVVADSAMKGPISRTATPDEWKTALKQAVKDRFGRYDGDTYYDMAINVVGYALAPPGIPIVLSPKSVLVVEVRLFFDATQKQLNAEPRRFVVFEGLSPQTFIGSGLTQTKAQEMKILSYNTAKDIEKWLVKHPQWFPMQGNPIPETPKPKAGAAAKVDATTKAKGAAKGAGGAAKKPDPNAIIVTPIPAPAK